MDPAGVAQHLCRPRGPPFGLVSRPQHTHTHRGHASVVGAPRLGVPLPTCMGEISRIGEKKHGAVQPDTRRDGWRDEEPPGEVPQFEPTGSCSVTSSATSPSFHLSASSSLRHLHLCAQESLKKVLFIPFFSLSLSLSTTLSIKILSLPYVQKHTHTNIYRVPLTLSQAHIHTHIRIYTHTHTRCEALCEDESRWPLCYVPSSSSSSSSEQ